MLKDVQCGFKDHFEITVFGTIYCIDKQKQPIFIHFIKQTTNFLFLWCFPKIWQKDCPFAQYGKNNGKLYNMVNLLVKLLHIWCQVLKYSFIF